jgi:hypothetical protein
MLPHGLRRRTPTPAEATTVSTPPIQFGGALD